MSETTLTKPKRKTAADYEAIAVQLLAEMERINEQMDRDRAESELLKARTSETLSRLQEQINRLSRPEKSTASVLTLEAQDDWERMVLGTGTDCGVSLPHTAFSCEYRGQYFDRRTDCRRSRTDTNRDPADFCGNRTTPKADATRPSPN